MDTINQTEIICAFDLFFFTYTSDKTKNPKSQYKIRTYIILLENIKRKMKVLFDHFTSYIYTDVFFIINEKKTFPMYYDFVFTFSILNRKRLANNVTLCVHSRN